VTLWDHLKSVARQMLRDPRGAARGLMQADVPRNVVLMAFFAIMAVSVVATEPLLAAASQMLGGEPASPFARAVGSVIGGLAVVWLIWKVGGAFGGTGGFDHILLAFVFLETLFVIGLAGLIILTLIMPPLTGLAGIGFVVFWLWMFSNVVAEMHEYPSAWKAFGVVVMSWVAVNYASMMVVSLLSGGPANV